MTPGSSQKQSKLTTGKVILSEWAFLSGEGMRLLDPRMPWSVVPLASVEKVIF